MLHSNNPQTQAEFEAEYARAERIAETPGPRGPSED